METRSAKKLKLQLESSMDPLLMVHPDLHDMIFQHLSFEDVLKCSQVSTDWKWSIATSRKCLSKIQLKFDDSSNEANLKELGNIKREYRNLRLTIKNENNHYQVIRLLQKFAPTLLNLKLDFEQIKNFSEPVDFPKLGSLDIAGCHVSQICETGYFKNVTTLKKLRVKFVLTDDSKISDWIMKQNKLEELFFNCNTDYIFKNDLLADASFSLRSFKFVGFFHGFFRADHTSIQIANFHKFLLKMSDSLTFLSILITHVETIEFAVNNLPNLKKFHCLHIKGVISNLKFKPNKSITELKLLAHVSKHTEALFKSLVNLEVLITPRLDKNDLKWIIRNMKTLKKLNIQYFGAWFRLTPYIHDLEECIAVYDKLKETDEEINRDIVLASK
jgi:hypothetical protein